MGVWIIIWLSVALFLAIVDLWLIWQLFNWLLELGVLI